MGRTVALVGASHPAARALAVALEADSGTDRIIGVSEADTPVLGPRFELVRAVPGDGRFREALGGAEVAVLFPMVRVDDVAGTEDRVRRSLEATLAAAAGAGTIVLWSSGIVYGAHADNPVPMTEEQQVAPNPSFPPALALADAEDVVLAQGAPEGGRTVTVFRGAGVWSPAWGTFLARGLALPGMPMVRGYDPPVQALHPHDALAALLLALRTPLPGVFNVAPDDWLPLSAAATAAGRRAVPIPEGVARSAFGPVERLGVTTLTAGELPYRMHPWVLDNSRLRSAGWSPGAGTGQALADAGREPRPSLLPPGASRTALYRGAAAAAAAGLGAVTLAWSRRRRG